METNLGMSGDAERQFKPPSGSAPAEKDSPSPRLRSILDNALLDLNSAAQSLISQMKFDNDRDRALVHVEVVTQLVDSMSRMMAELNKSCQEIYREISERQKSNPDVRIA